jgi:hypothetical protein
MANLYKLVHAKDLVLDTKIRYGLKDMRFPKMIWNIYKGLPLYCKRSYVNQGLIL